MKTNEKPMKTYENLTKTYKNLQTRCISSVALRSIVCCSLLEEYRTHPEVIAQREAIQELIDGAKPFTGE